MVEWYQKYTALKEKGIKMKPNNDKLKTILVNQPAGSMPDGDGPKVCPRHVDGE